jgi:hypothetical protein
MTNSTAGVLLYYHLDSKFAQHPSVKFPITALIQLDRLNINNCVRDTSENNQNVLQIIQLNIVTCILYLFILFYFYRYTKFDVL